MKKGILLGIGVLLVSLASAATISPVNLAQKGGGDTVASTEFNSITEAIGFLTEVFEGVANDLVTIIFPRVIQAPAVISEGGVTIGSVSQECATGIEGMFRYNLEAHIPEFCNGTEWLPINYSTCEAQTCEDVARECGVIDDGCGIELECGTCNGEELCSELGTCVLPTCTPTETCGADDCGTKDNGCGELLDCGVCQTAQVEWSGFNTGEVACLEAGYKTCVGAIDWSNDIMSCADEEYGGWASCEGPQLYLIVDDWLSLSMYFMSLTCMS